MPQGKLDVYVEGAVAIKDTALIGKGSPYCSLTMGTQVYSSPPIEEGGTHPYFNTRFEFNVDRSTQQLMVAIYSKKSLTDDDLLGYCTIYFKDAFYHSHVVPVTSYALTRPSGRPGGHIRLSLTFHAQPRPPAPAPGGYAPPQPRAPVAPYRQPRPPGPSYAPPRGPAPPAGAPYRQPRPPQAPYPPQGPYRPHQYAEPQRVGEEEDSESSSENSGSDSDDDGPPGPYKPQYAPRGRGRAGPPPGRGGPRPRPPGPAYRGPAPPPPPPQPVDNSVMGSLMQNLGGILVDAAVGSVLGSDGDDVSVDGSFGYVETASYGTVEDGGFSGTVFESFESYESYEEQDVYDESSSYQPDAAGAPAGGYGYAPGPPAAAGGPGPRGRGRAGPPPGARGGPPGRGRGPPGRAPMRGRGPIARGRGPPPMRGRGPPAGY